MKRYQGKEPWEEQQRSITVDVIALMPLPLSPGAVQQAEGLPGRRARLQETVPGPSSQGEQNQLNDDVLINFPSVICVLCSL